ncbi:MAG: hypothetical protein DRJ05_12175, partial [Bacteroidetes bacterium]
IDFADTELLVTKPNSYETQIPGVYIGGDAMRGASTAINAIGDGRKAAEQMIARANVISRHNLPESRIEQNRNWHTQKRSYKTPPVKVQETNLDDRKNFNLVTSPLTKEQAMTEASRCLLCDEVCNICTTLCPNLSLFGFDIEPVNYLLQSILVKDGKYIIKESGNFEVKQKHQILHIADWCNECGNCTTFCPTAGSPYKEKPHLYLNKAAFENDFEGYYLEERSGDYRLLFKNEGQIYTLKLNKNDYIFESKDVILNLEKGSLGIASTQLKDNNKEFELDLGIAIQMSIVLEGALSFYGHNPVFKNNQFQV